MKKLIKRHYIIILSIVSALIILSAYDKYWAPLDEGVVTVAAEMILHNKIPYKDIFMVNYPPGQIYTLALLYKAFGVTLEIGRIYTCFVQIFIALLVFLICRMITKRVYASFIVWFIALWCLSPRLGSIPAPIWPSIGLALFSIYLFIKYIEQEKQLYVIYSAFVVGITIIFRHDIGLFLFISIFITLIVYRQTIRRILVFTLSSLVLPLLIFYYLILREAFSDAIEALFQFPFIHQKTASLFFPKPCFDPRMIFHQSLYFIKQNQYYIPLLIYGFIVIYLFIRLFKNRKLAKIDIMLFVIMLFGVLIFNQVRIRTDPAHLLSVIYPSIILFGFILNKALFMRDAPKGIIYIYRAYVLLISFLLCLLVIKNIDKYFKNVFRKPFKKSIILTRFDRGSVYIPKEEREDLKSVVSFIESSTGNTEQIYVGNIANWKDDFGGSLILHTLCARLPSTKYYEIVPGLLTQKKVQEDIVQSLSKNVNFIILQDIEIPKKRKVDSDKLLLDNYIKNNFKQVKKFGKYNIYEKNNIYR